MKLYIHYEITGDDKTTTKLTVPKSWYSKAVFSVIQLFCDSYNKKHMDAPLVDTQVHIETKENEKIYSDGIISEMLMEHGDYFIKMGEYVKPVRKVATESDILLLRCKNYGCGRSFKDEDNHEECCFHHTKPPVFHDTIKYWGCCQDRKAYDWDEFQLITGCSRGTHSTVDPKIALGSFRTVEEKSETEVQPVLKTISDYNKANPDAVTAAQSAVKMIAPVVRKSSRNENGTAKCKNKGCQKEFIVADNHSSACRFHAKNAVFHDTLKFWGCCSDKKRVEFDDFMAVPGCVQGFHDDGVITLPEDHGTVFA
jgi:hypothetical protein